MSEPSPASNAAPAEPSREEENPSPPDGPTKEASPSPIMKGVKWGALAGFVVAQLYVRNHSHPFGFYGGSPNMLAVFAVWTGLGSAIGAGIGWLSKQPPDDERLPR